MKTGVLAEECPEGIIAEDEGVMAGYGGKA